MSGLLTQLQDQHLLDYLGIRVREYEDRAVFDYSQIDSPKTHPLVMQCRGLITNKERTEIICRPFDRFFNLGEAPETQATLDMTKAIAYEKVDGSLIKIYYYKDNWEIATRGTAFAEGSPNGFDLTFRDLVLKAIRCNEYEFQMLVNDLLMTNVTYLFEVTSFENKVVTHYNGYTLHYLGARENITGYPMDQTETICKVLGASLPIKFPKTYTFSTPKEAIESANALGGLKEGFVVWQDGKPIAKIKSDAYVTAHHIRGEGLSPKRIAELVLSGEHKEYLNYFASDAVHFEPYKQALTNLEKDLVGTYEATKQITDQKEFAKQVKDKPFSAILFSAKKNNFSPMIAFSDSRLAYRVELLLSYVSADRLPTL